MIHVPHGPGPSTTWWWAVLVQIILLLLCRLPCLLGPRAQGPYRTSLNYRTMAQARAGFDLVLVAWSLIKIVKFKDNPNGKLLRGLSIGNDLDTTGRTSVLLHGRLYSASTLHDASSNDTEGFPRARAASNRDGPTFQKAGERWRNLFKTLGHVPVHFIHLLSL